MSDNFESLRKSSVKSGILSLVGILIFIFSLVFASYNLYKSNKELDKVKTELKSSVDSLKKEKKKVEGLKSDELQLNQYLISLINSTQANQGHQSLKITKEDEIDWGTIKHTLLNLAPGRRKLALTIALLTTWKEIPFELSKNNPKSSFDSPGYMQYILRQVGINIQRKKDEPLSATLMKKFKKVEHPLPGDLIFYKGQVGSYGLIYLCGETQNTQGFAIGTLQAAFPLTIYNTYDMNTKDFPVFRVLPS